MCARPSNPELREKILVAATQIIEECGPDCVTMREVAEKIGYSPTTIYLYFKDKSALLSETLIRAFSDLADAANLAMVGPTSLDKMRQRSRAYVVWGITHPGLYRLMFETPSSLEFTPQESSMITRGLTDGGKLMTDSIAAGEIEVVGDRDVTGSGFFAAMHGATSLAISGRLGGVGGPLSKHELYDLATRTADDLINAMLDRHVVVLKP